MTVTISVIGMILSVIGTGIAVLSYGRATAGQLPVVDIVVEEHASGDLEYKLRIDNPSRHSLLLDQIQVIRPDPDGVNIRPTNISSYGDLKRSMADLSSALPGQKSVYLSVPAGESRELDLLFADEEIDIDLRLIWSSGLSFPDKFFLRKKVVVNADQFESMKLAAATRAS